MPTEISSLELVVSELQWLLDCEFESLSAEAVIRNLTYPITYEEGDLVTEDLSFLSISPFYKDFGDYQYLIGRYVTASGQRGFGQLCHMTQRDNMTMEAWPGDLETVTKMLNSTGHERLHLIVEGLKDRSLVDES